MRASTKLNPERVRDVSVEVFKMRLGPADTQAMLDKDADGGRKLRERAGSYDTLTRCYLKAIAGVE